MNKTIISILICLVCMPNDDFTMMCLNVSKILRD